jgi:hypothetical protein
LTPVALLAEARALGVELMPEPPDGIRMRGPRKALTPELRERLRAVKPELLALLGSEVRRVRVRDAWSASFGRLAALARTSWPTTGAAVLRWLRPEWARDLEEAEAAADTAGHAHLNGGPWEVFAGALARWEASQVDVLRLLARVCHDCGREAAVAVVLDDGRRLCRWCLAPSDSPAMPGRA